MRSSAGASVRGWNGGAGVLVVGKISHNVIHMNRFSRFGIEKDRRSVVSTKLLENVVSV